MDLYYTLSVRYKSLVPFIDIPYLSTGHLSPRPPSQIKIKVVICGTSFNRTFNVAGPVRQSAIPGVSGLQPSAVVPGQSSSHYYSVPNLLPQTPVQQPQGLHVPQVFLSLILTSKSLWLWTCLKGLR